MKKGLVGLLSVCALVFIGCVAESEPDPAPTPAPEPGTHTAGGAPCDHMACEKCTNSTRHVACCTANGESFCP
jgi:hypothetical protein